MHGVRIRPLSARASRDERPGYWRQGRKSHEAGTKRTVAPRCRRVQGQAVAVTMPVADHNILRSTAVQESSASRVREQRRPTKV